MRPTVLIRRMLQIEYLQAELSRQMREVRRELQRQGITVLQTERRPLDVRVQYRVDGRHYEALFMIPMLHAEVEGWFRRWMGERPL